MREIVGFCKRVLILILISLSFSFGDSLRVVSLQSEIDAFSQKIISSLDLSPQSTISVSLIENDRHYMSDLSPIYELIRENLVGKLSGSQVQFTSVDGSSSALVYDLLSNGVKSD